MIYEIDESCLAILNTKENMDAIAFFEQLALDRKKCKNIVVANREVFSELSQNTKLSEVSRNIYRVLGGRMCEKKMLLKITKKYCRLVARNIDEKVYREGEHEIILLDIRKAANKDFTSYTLMLAENEEDIEFYKLIGIYFLKKNKLANLNINFENRHGGGGTMSNILDRIVNEKSKMCLCIVDSDRKYKDDTPGETMQRVKKVEERYPREYYDVILLEIHEIENMIPISVLEKVIKNMKLPEEGLSFAKYLLQYDNTLSTPYFYFDLKMGIHRNAFILKENANQEIEKKFRKKELYRRYWKLYIEDYGIVIDENANEFLIDGICQRILRYSLKYMQEMNKEDKLASIQVCDPIETVWNQIGEQVYCWGCVGGRIAV